MGGTTVSFLSLTKIIKLIKTSFYFESGFFKPEPNIRLYFPLVDKTISPGFSFSMVAN